MFVLEKFLGSLSFADIYTFVNDLSQLILFWIIKFNAMATLI